MDYKKYAIDATKLPYADCSSVAAVLTELFPQLGESELSAGQYETCWSESQRRMFIYRLSLQAEKARMSAQFRSDAETELGITHWPDDLKAVLYDIVEGFDTFEETFSAMQNMVKFSEVYYSYVAPAYKVLPPPPKAELLPEPLLTQTRKHMAARHAAGLVHYREDHESKEDLEDLNLDPLLVVEALNLMAEVTHARYDGEFITIEYHS